MSYRWSISSSSPEPEPPSISRSEALQLQQHELEERGFSLDEVRKAKQDAAQALFTRFYDAEELLRMENEILKVSFNCSSLDKLTGGGLYLHQGVSEIYGESGSGKTQICLQLAVSTARMGLNCAYINTEKRFPIKRLSEMIGNQQHLLHSIWIAEDKDRQSVERLLDRDLRLLLIHRKVGLVIIDSVAGLFRELSEDLISRAKGMRKFNDLLSQLQAQYQFGIVCTNQVASSIAVVQMFGAPSVNPCLGPIWTEFLTNRFRVKKRERSFGNSLTVRSLEVDFSPYLESESKATFLVDTCGLRDA